MPDTPTFEWPEKIVEAVAKKLFVTNFFTPPPMPETWDAQHPIERATHMNKTRTALSALSPQIEELVEALRDARGIIDMLINAGWGGELPVSTEEAGSIARIDATIAKWGRS